MLFAHSNRTSLARIPVVLALLCAGVAAQSITTTFASNGGLAEGGGTMFDITVLTAKPLMILSFDVNVGEAPGVPAQIDVFVTPTTYVGKENNAAAWTRVASGQGTTAGFDMPTAVDTGDFVLVPGSYGMYVQYPINRVRYTNGNGTNQSYLNAELSLQLGVSKPLLFGGATFSPRVWNGTIHYTTEPSTFVPFGRGCPGSAGVVTLSAQNGTRPAIGSTFDVGIDNLPAAAGNLFMLWAASDRVWNGLRLPLDLTPLGMPGCDLSVAPVAIDTIAHAGGQATAQVMIPGLAALIGGKFYAQAVVADPGANALGFVMSEGGAGQLGR